MTPIADILREMLDEHGQLNRDAVLALISEVLESHALAYELLNKYAEANALRLALLEIHDAIDDREIQRQKDIVPYDDSLT